METVIRALLFETTALLPCFVGMLLCCKRRIHLLYAVLMLSGVFVLSLPFAVLQKGLVWTVCACAAGFLVWGQIVCKERRIDTLPVGLSFLTGAFLAGWYTQRSLLPWNGIASALNLPLPIFLCLCLLLLFTGVLPMCTVTILTRIFLRDNRQTRSRLVWLLYLPFPLCQFFLLQRTLPQDIPSANAHLGYLVLAIGMCLIVDIALTFGVRSVETSAALRVRYAALSQQISSQAVYYRQVAGYYQRLRQLRHDMQNHAYTMKILLQQNNVEQAQAYGEQLRKSAHLSDLQPICAHPIADMFLSQKQADLADEKISLELHLDLPAELNIANGDLLSALDHLIDGAAAVSRQSHGGVHLFAAYNAPRLVLRVSPAFSVLSASRKNRELPTTDVLILETLTARYAGELSVQSADGAVYTVLVLHEEVKA